MEGKQTAVSLFSKGSDFCKLFVQKTLLQLNSEQFWDYFTIAKTLSQASRRFKRDDDIEISGPQHLCSLYLGAIQQCKVKGFGPTTDVGVKSCDLEDLFNEDLTIKKFSSLLLKKGPGDCLFAHLFPKTLPRHLIPLVATYLDFASNFCPHRGFCDNADKAKCTRSVDEALPRISSSVSLMIAAGVYSPVCKDTRGFRDSSWTHFESVEGSSNMERAIALMDRVLFGLAFVPPGDGEVFFSRQSEFSSSVLVADTAYSIHTSDRFAEFRVAAGDLVPVSIVNRVEKVLDFPSGAWAELRDRQLTIPLMAYALEQSKSIALEKGGLRIDVPRTLKANFVLVNRDNVNDLLESVTRLSDEDTRLYLDLLLCASRGNPALDGLSIYMSDESTIPIADLASSIDGFLPLLDEEQIQAFPLAFLCSDKKFSREPTGNTLALTWAMVRAGGIGTDSVNMAQPADRDGTTQLIERICSRSSMLLLEKNIQEYQSLEARLNQKIWSNDQALYSLPNNREVYTLLKGTALGKKELVSNKLRHLYRDKNRYSKVAILVFDGLGYVPLRWAATDYPRLDKILANQAATAVGVSMRPTLTAVNHCALLSDLEVHEDVFLNRGTGSFGSASLSRFQKKWDGPKVLDTDRCLFNLVEGGEFISQFHPKSSLLSQCITNGYGRYTKIDGYVDAIRVALESESRFCVSQVNIMDRFLENYIAGTFIKHPSDFIVHTISLVKQAFQQISRNIQPDTLVLVVSDHGLGWWPGNQVISTIRMAESIASPLPGCSSEVAPWGGDQCIVFKRNGTPIALMKPDTGTRRVASIFPLTLDAARYLLSSQGFVKLREECEVKTVERPRPLDPLVILLGRDKVFSSLDGKEWQYFAGLHGGMSAWEMLVPIMCFDASDMDGGDGN